MGDLRQRVGYTVMFLQMTVTEMHKLAEATPEIARELGHIAEQVQVEAHSLAEHISE
jgi:hypothetical protein